MLFEFTPAIKAGIEVGKYTEILSNGISIGIVRDTVSGSFVAHADGILVDSYPISPLVVPVQFLMTGVYMVQNHITSSEISQQNGFVRAALQSLQTNLEVLQATIALIELSRTPSIALEAVKLHQALKLKKKAEEMQLEVRNGFIDLQQIFKNQKSEIRQIVKEVVYNDNFKQHCTILLQAYKVFIEAINRLQTALTIQNTSHRYAEFDSAREMLFKVLEDYINSQSLEATSAPGQLRRFECAWAIEQAIIVTYQIQNEVLAVSDQLCHLRNKIKEQICTVINNCESYDELSFLFPEISRICKHDLAILEIWQAQVDWVHSLSEMEMKLLARKNWNTLELASFLDTHQSTTVPLVPPEELIYEDLAKNSHFYSILDQLIFLFKPVLRQEYEVYINQQAHATGHNRLVQRNLQQASDMTIANLYYYFRVRDESNTEETLALV
ncbi:unknown protein [Nostoc sp. NIES-3756]|uniref:hypothetical protein n=1 Tax=Nostoc sp. NIES-3756 TaxID=1751286 RepID=UPI0007209433|nr:hypothetical protein [Nostoc sp. NIES-3756]BAT54054.1 unknown protein [Nostoc sp. NIES-3756]BAY38207.1 hypothetical protein NIES2111_25520 [Nostoc sp. NIES-2111]